MCLNGDGSGEMIDYNSGSLSTDDGDLVQHCYSYDSMYFGIAASQRLLLVRMYRETNG